MNYKSIVLLSLLYLLTSSGIKQKELQKPPNIILIMADDMGYECLSSNGALTYSTPVLDQLAQEGIRFTKAISQPLCTPSRVKIMTGQYNYRNYEHFTYLNSNQRTFGQLMKEAGYATAIVGKWQLNGLVYKLPGFDDVHRPKSFGFEEYCLWQLTHPKPEGERFANPLLEQNGQLLPRNEEAYGPDIVSNFALDFMDRNKDKPFFIYYPMLLVHSPFVPTPDSEAWADKDRRYEKDTAYFKDMVAYTDKIVGRFVDKLKALDLYDNTILIFTGDNGTHKNIISQTQTGPLRGAKGNTIDAGTHVPLVVSWPEKIKKSFVYDGLIEFSDFYPTLADIVGKKEETDGQSFYKLLLGKKHQDRRDLFVHYDPKWSKNVNQYRNQFARTTQYKLYQDGQFFDLSKDPQEEQPLKEADCTKKELKIKQQLQAVIDKAPDWKD